MNEASIWDPEKERRIPTVQDIVKAQEILSGTIKRTPLQTSRTFSGIAGKNLFLKLECLQVTGSFKVRGAFVKINKLSWHMLL
jgi:threonine dehydratase